MTPDAGRPKAILIAGPTASGKSAAALDLAQRFGGIVINADSMQVYRELAAYLAGDSSLEAAVEKAKTESRRYAKRQMTWARRFMQDWQWFPNAAAVLSATKP